MDSGRGQVRMKALTLHRTVFGPDIYLSFGTGVFLHFVREATAN